MYSLKDKINEAYGSQPIQESMNIEDVQKAYEGNKSLSNYILRQSDKDLVEIHLELDGDLREFKKNVSDIRKAEYYVVSELLKGGEAKKKITNALKE